MNAMTPVAELRQLGSVAVLAAGLAFAMTPAGARFDRAQETATCGAIAAPLATDWSAPPIAGRPGDPF